MAGRLSQAAAAGAPMAPALADAAAAAGAPPPGAAAGGSPVGAEAGAGAPPPQPAAPAQGAAPSPEAGAPPVPPPGAGAPPAAADPRAQQGARGGQQGSPVDPYLQQADPRQQQEYERAMRGMAKVLYGTDNTANAIVDQIKPNSLVSDTAKVSMLFVKELDRAINMDESVIAEVTRESVERIAELAEARHGIEYQPTDMEKILGATWEGVQSMFGNEDVEGYIQTVQGMNPQDLQALKQQQESILAKGQGSNSTGA